MGKNVMDAHIRPMLFGAGILASVAGGYYVSPMLLWGALALAGILLVAGFLMKKLPLVVMGSVVVLGVGGGYWVTSYGFLLSLSVGAALFFSGLFGICGLSAFLAKRALRK